MKFPRGASVRVGWLTVMVAMAALAATAWAASVPSRVTQPVNDAIRVTLRGNTPPLARAEYDHGLAPDYLPLRRMLLVLQRSSGQEAALQKLLVVQQVKSSPEYHQWLTPQGFGERFGPADSDIQAVTDWLTAEGFQVNRVAAGRTVIEFSGTAGLVRQSLHTEIHKYVVAGKAYWANASDPQIPAALKPVVTGIASLNNFPRRPLYRRVGVFTRSKTTGKFKPLYTFSTNGTTFYALGPTDFATVYNVLPLYKSTPAINGTGENIAVVAVSNINIQDVRDFRSIFGLPANDPQVILDGPDPGLIPDSESEADIDTQWSGAVAPNATIKLVVSEDTETTAGVDLSALYIIDNDIAPILSESFGACELALGNAGNAFESGMWEQAAAEGITVVVASGDTGSAGCDDSNTETSAQFGLAVSGTASTPFNVAVGGTDFDKPSSFFSSTNDPTTQASAKSYVPEITWNDSCARSGSTTGCSVVASDGSDLVAAGGGPSNCASQDALGNCTAGYAKPSWQSGTGVPQDGVRDIPDVSLFASDGIDGSFYIFCQSDKNPKNAPCSLSGDFLGAGGTSLSTPAFAGIMALVNQKTGQRQGNANFVLYPLAAAAAKNGAYCTSNASAVGNSACIFYDITMGHNSLGGDITPGNNSVACAGGTLDCSNTAKSSFGILVNPSSTSTPAWTTSAGYDLATGLGTVNAANLVDNWGSVSFNSTSTALISLSPTTLTHGTPVAANIKVTSGGGTPTGAVELIAAINGTNFGVGTFTLSGGLASGTTDLLPGGSYSVTAHYAGDGAFGSSDSTPPVSVTVSPETSFTQVHVVTFNPLNGQETSANATSFAFGSPYVLRVDILNAANNPCAPLTNSGQVSPTSGCPTGTVTLTDNGAPLNDFDGNNTVTLNSQGYLEDQPINVNVGAHTFAAAYSGDNSFNASSGSDAVTVTQASTTTAASAPSTVSAGQSFNVAVTVSTQSNSPTAPSGTVQLFNSSTAIGSPATCVGSGATTTAFALCQATIPLTLTSNASLTAKYSGDTNYSASTSGIVTVTVIADFSMSSNPTTNTVARGSAASYTISATGAGGFSGTVNFVCAVTTTPIGAQHVPTCSLNPTSAMVGSSAGTTTLTVNTTAASLVPPLGGGSPHGLPLAPIAGYAALMLLLAAGVYWARARRRALAGAMVAGIILLSLMGLASCGGGGGGGGGGGSTGTTAGAYTITVTGTSGSLSNTAKVTLTVQ